MQTELAQLADRIRAAASSRTPLRIRAGGTKDFYGNEPRGEVLDPRVLSGIVAYEPTELVITASSGTPLAEIEAALAVQGQMLAFEPPHFGAAATLGGCIASGLSGPRRASSGVAYGSVRDFVLGAKLLDGRGQPLSFGGTVMKNVAGYDVSRLLAGSLGILGVITEVSLKVLPLPGLERTLAFEMDETTVLDRLNEWGARPLPISASAWLDGALMLRLSGAPAAVDAAALKLGGQEIPGTQATQFWRDVREHALPFFADNVPLWRVALPSAAPPMALDELQLIEWGGALRWVHSRRPMDEIRARAASLGGHATRFRGGDRSGGTFTPLLPAVAAIHRRLKAEFDPAGIFNPGRMY